MNLSLLNAGNFALDGGAMFGVVPKALWKKAYNPGDEDNRIPLAAKVLLIESNDRKILVDTGNGTKFNDKQRKIYGIPSDEDFLQTELDKRNICVDEITDVILTHLHFDHAGGATALIDNEILPRFKNAKYYVQKDQYEWAKNPSIKDRASFFVDNFLPLNDNNQLELLDGDTKLFPGIEVFRLNGHTKGMQLVKITNENDTFLYMADLAPTQAHIKVAYGMGYDNEPLKVIEEKNKFLSAAVEENWTLVFEHDAFNNAAKIVIGDKGFQISEQIKI